jgi:hypothetical protein
VGVDAVIAGSGTFLCVCKESPNQRICRPLPVDGDGAT